MQPNISKIARLIGDESRASILMLLMSGKALTAGELAKLTHISPQTASNHLKKLMSANLIICHQSGRHRYYRLASDEIATIIESLGLLCNHDITIPGHQHIDKKLCFARCCYNHIAGKLGVQLANSLLRKGYIEPAANNFTLTEKGREFFTAKGIMITKTSKPVTKACLDWTERQSHLAGALGTALMDYMINERILIPSTKIQRALTLTTKGSSWLKKNFDI